MKKFWMVYNPGNRGPTIEHGSLQFAEREAGRLAKENPGKKFVVLEAISVCKMHDVLWQILNYDDIPF